MRVSEAKIFPESLVCGGHCLLSPWLNIRLKFRARDAAFCEAMDKVDLFDTGKTRSCVKKPIKRQKVDVSSPKRKVAPKAKVTRASAQISTGRHFLSGHHYVSSAPLLENCTWYIAHSKLLHLGNKKMPSEWWDCQASSKIKSRHSFLFQS